MNIIMVRRSLDVACFVYSLNVCGKKIVFYPHGHAAVWWWLAWLREMSRNCFSVMRRCKGRKIGFLICTSNLKCRDVCLKSVWRGVFLLQKCVCLVTPRTTHVYYYYIRSCPRAKFCFLFPVKVNNCWNFQRWLERTQMSMLVKQTSFVSLWSVLFCVRTNKICLLAVVAWCEMRPHQGYVQKQKKQPPWSSQVEQTLQIGSCLTSLWCLGGGQRVPVGHPLDQVKPGMLRAIHTECFQVCLALLSFFFKLPPLKPS